jgi:hypothetical protein
MPIASHSQNNHTGPYTSSVTLVAYQTAAGIVNNATLLAQWLAELDQQFNATNPSAGQRKIFQIERQRLLQQSDQGSIE